MQLNANRKLKGILSTISMGNRRTETEPLRSSSREKSALQLVCGKVLKFQASPLMKVSTEIKSHEQKGKDETIQEANFAVDLTDSKLTPDEMFCKVGGHAFLNFMHMKETDGSVAQQHRS